MTRRRPIPLLLIALFLWATGCHSYTQIGLSEVADHGKVRVTTALGDRLTIHDPQVEADSIRGKNWPAIQLDQITEVEAVSTDAVGIAFIVLGVVVAAGVATLIYYCAEVAEADAC